VGEHDLETSEKLMEMLVALVQTNALVVVDLSETVFVDSSILDALVHAERVARES
jgi:anti-anti-sigma regulatory factor